MSPARTCFRPINRAGRPFRLGGTAAYDACTVLPLSAVQEAGIEIDSYPLVRHDFVERDAPGDLALAWKGLEGLTNCTWPGVDDQHIILQIYQPPFSHDWERTSRLDFLERKGAKEDSYRGGSPQDVVNKLVDGIVANLQRHRPDRRPSRTPGHMRASPTRAPCSPERTSGRPMAWTTSAG